MRSHSDSERTEATKTGHALPHQMPRWVKIFGIIAAIAVATFGALHFAGGGMEHLAHGGVAEHILPDEHGRHVP